MMKTVKVFETGSVISDIIFENTAQNVVWGNDNADFAVVMPRYKNCADGKYGMLLVPYKASCRCTADKVITYGMESSSIITLSSVGEDKCVMTLQEEIFDLWGKVIEPQDLVISRMHLEPEEAMAAAAALLITGADKKLWGI